MVKKQNEKTKEKGITLIVLAITVIVMLILAGVVLNYALGEGGLIGRAEDASNRYQKAEENEIAYLNRVDQKYDSILNRVGGGDIEEIPMPSPTNNPNPTTSPSPSPTTPPTGGTVEDSKGDKFEDTTTITDKNGEKVTIPGGFTVSPDSSDDVNGGIVVVDEHGNEFVWVPVPDPTTMYVEETVTLAGEYATTNRYSKLRVTSSQKPGSKGYREPDFLTDTTNGDASTTSGRGISQLKDVLGITGSTNNTIMKVFSDNLVEEYNAMIDSVIKYKGFYIGRYELTGTVDNPASKSGEVLANQNWYSFKKACNNLINNQYVQSCMIYGCQWDETLSWLIRSGAKTEEEVNTNSRSWGNYKDSIGEAAINSGAEQNTGINEAWKANNIYDLAGNHFELTQEAGGDSARIMRGRLLGVFRFRRTSYLPLYILSIH